MMGEGNQGRQGEGDSGGEGEEFGRGPEGWREEGGKWREESTFLLKRGSIMNTM